MKSNLVEVSCFLHVDTDDAILISETNEEEKAVWCPKSQIDIENSDGAQFSIVTMPEWLAYQKGLI